VGIHVPAYDFERSASAARREIWRLGISYPVALDHRFEVFRAYGNRDLPARHVIDTDGLLRGWHEGPGGLLEAEKAVRALLKEAAPAAPLPLPVELPEGALEAGDLAWMPSPEIRFGTRGAGFGPPLGELGGEAPEEGTTREFESLPELRAQGHAYLEGQWRVEADRIVCEREEGALAVVFEGSSVDAVVSLPEGAGEDPVVLEVTVDGEPLPIHRAGADVELDGDRSRVAVERGRVYELVSSIEFDTHNLDVRIRGGAVGFHLLHFGTSLVPEE
jgi:hypothetical protein